jgi:amidophosphoribosyltransferase
MVTCAAGVDLPSRKEFVAHNLSDQRVCEVLGADGLIYQSVDALLATGHELNPDITQFDASCFNGEYVAGAIDEEYLQLLESGGRGKKRSIDRQAGAASMP